MQPHIQRVTHAIQQLQQGKPIILVDDATRENEGDFIFPAEMITPTMMNFIIRHSSGVVCLALPEAQLQQLQLPLMLPPMANTSFCQTPFTLSIDAASGISTGVSAADRVQTVQAAIADGALPTDLARPGHVFPLQARAGGVFERAGHTEGSVDLMRLAGLKPAAVIAELMNVDGTVAKGVELTAFAKEHDLVVLTIEDVIDYRLSQESLIAEQISTQLPLAQHGTFETLVLREKYNSKEHMVLMRPSRTEAAPLVRIHSACVTGDLWGSLRCDCGEQLQYALQQIERDGGILIYLNQEGRDIGLFNKIRAYQLQDQGHDTISANIALGLPVDARKYYIAAHVLKQLGIDSVRLLTNNPHKIADLKKYGITTVQREPIVMLSNSHNAAYLTSKQRHHEQVGVE